MIFFAVIFVAAAALLCIAAIRRFAFDCAVGRILKYKRGEDSFLPDLYSAAFGRRYRVVEDIYVPSGRHDGKIYRIPLMLVGRAGIILVEEKRMSGFIENPMRGDWRQFHGNRIVQFQNPIESNLIHAQAVRKRLSSHGYPVPPVRGVIVFSEDDVRFKNRFRQVVTAELSVGYIRELMKENVISKIDADRIAGKLMRDSGRLCSGRASLAEGVRNGF